MQVRSNKGFSLIELMIAIGILGIVFAIAMPNFNKNRLNTNLKEAARDISSDISHYKQRAIAENRAYRINFNAAANNYTIQQETVVLVGGVPTRTGIYVNFPTPKNVGAGNLNIVIFGAPSFGGFPYIQLDPRGTASNTCANNCILVLRQNQRLSIATITTNVMGRVDVQYVLK